MVELEGLQGPTRSAFVLFPVLHSRADSISNKLLYSYTVIFSNKTNRLSFHNMCELGALDHCYPTSFVSNDNMISTQLQVLPNKTLLNSVRRFGAKIPSDQRTKAMLAKLITDDFSQKTKELVGLSTEELCGLASPPANGPILQLPLVCQLVHKRYGPEVAPQLLCEPTRWNPPEFTEGDAIVPSVNWLEIPVDHLKVRLSKVDSSAIKACCDLYPSRDPTPKSKSAKYSAIVERFRSCSLFLFRLSDTEFFKNYFALFPYDMPTHEASRRQLVEEIMKEEFGHEISNPLLQPPSSERKNEKRKEVRRANQKCSVAAPRLVPLPPSGGNFPTLRPLVLEAGRRTEDSSGKSKGYTL